MDDAELRDDDDRTLYRAVLHRWFVQYNPLYLVSATLVLGGVITLSSGIAGGGVFAQLGVTAIAEVYAWALIASAALLVRIGLRRPAVMLALLAALYQVDPTLHTATCAFLGPAGVIGSVLWFLSFVGKLRALAWAMKLRPSRGSTVLIVGGALGLAAIPWLLRTVDAPTASTGLILWSFGLMAAGLWSPRKIESLTPLGPWPATVARRSFRAIWIGWGAASVLHMLFWAAHFPETLQLTGLVPAALLLATRAIRAERLVWAQVGATLLLVLAYVPALLPLTLLMAAAVLVLRARRCPTLIAADADDETMEDPYRGLDDDSGDDVPRSDGWTLRPAPREQAVRLLVGASTCLYLAAWWRGWDGVALPAHNLVLDLLLVVVAVAAARRLRRGLPLLPATLSLTHLVIARQLLPIPTSTTQTGLLSIGVGFALLLVSLVISVRWSRTVAHQHGGGS